MLVAFNGFFKGYIYPSIEQFHSTNFYWQFQYKI